MANKVTIEFMDGSAKVIRQASFIKAEDGVLKMHVDDTAYTGHAENYVLANIKSYNVEKD